MDYKMKIDSRWGFLRESRKKAEKEGIDKVTGLHRTGLEDYLAVIFPGVDDWIHNKSIGTINGEKCSYRPDYRSESLKLIIEFDGTGHYKDPSKIVDDKMKTALFEKGGYKVVRIPFFIQLTHDVVKTLFGVEVKEELFPAGIPSMLIEWENTPAFMCPMGVERMARELLLYPEQLKTNLEALKKNAEEHECGSELSGYKMLAEMIERFKK